MFSPTPSSSYNMGRAYCRSSGEAQNFRLLSCPLLLQGHGLWHPQWTVQIWRHPGKHYLCFVRWDNQSGPHPSGCCFSGWRWPDCPSIARDPGAGPDVSNPPGEDSREDLFQDTPAQPHLLPLTVHRTPRTAQKENRTLCSLL